MQESQPESGTCAQDCGANQTCRGPPVSKMRFAAPQVLFRRLLLRAAPTEGAYSLAAVTPQHGRQLTTCSSLCGANTTQPGVFCAVGFLDSMRRDTRHHEFVGNVIRVQAANAGLQGSA